MYLETPLHEGPLFFPVLGMADSLFIERDFSESDAVPPSEKFQILFS